MTQLQAVATPMPEDPTKDMPLPQIVANLKDLKEEQALLEAALAKAKVEARDTVCTQINELIAANGFTNDEILPLLMPVVKVRKQRTKKVKAEGDAPTPAGEGNYPTYALKSDPTKTYVRGVLSAWMKEAIAAAGLDPKQGADRAKFKAEYMTVVAA